MIIWVFLTSSTEQSDNDDPDIDNISDNLYEICIDGSPLPDEIAEIASALA